jgi:hypothetical protein
VRITQAGGDIGRLQKRLPSALSTALATAAITGTLRATAGRIPGGCCCDATSPPAERQNWRFHFSCTFLPLSED